MFPLCSEGRLVRMDLQRQADDIQRRTASSREVMLAARAQQQMLQADLEQLNKVRDEVTNRVTCTNPL